MDGFFGSVSELMRRFDLLAHIAVQDRDVPPAAAQSAGECFGELSLLHSIPRTADVIVHSEDAVVLSLSETNLQRLISSESKLAAKFLLNLAKSLAMKLLSQTDSGEEINTPAR